jgi:hypothetical protein
MPPVTLISDTAKMALASQDGAQIPAGPSRGIN